jgi:cellulose synthase/poly-beta-1,6-N-acetylglucosamine synthase-like glycosyltransferase
MDWIENLVLFTFFLNPACIFIVFIGYPFFLYVISMGKDKKKNNIKRGNPIPFISVIVVFRNAETLIQQKVLNFSNLDYPKEKIELVLVSDGTTDNSLNLIKDYLSPFIRLFHFKDHLGKAHGLNFGVEQSRGSILVFSDADSILERKSITMLSQYFSDPAIGGVCGQRMVVEDISHIKSGQIKYIEWDSLIKSLEAKNGLSITSHDGKLYAVRKDLFKPVPEGVTDDSYISHSVIGQKYRFIFEPKAVAFIKIPSRNGWHEVKRRIRIVSTSLNGIKINRKLLNPFRFGLFSICLFVNKILRRMVPFALILFLFTSFILSSQGMALAIIALWVQIAGYAVSFLYPVFSMKWILNHASGRYLRKMSEIGFFFCLGMMGTFLGVLLFFSGKKIIKWEPEKG